MKAFKNILLTTDFSSSAAAAFPQALALAKQHHASVHMLHVIQHEALEALASGIVIGVQAWINARRRDSETKLIAMAGALQKEFGVHVTASCVPGNAVREIVNFAKVIAADVIVMATRGQTGMSHFMFGSVAERVVRLSAAPVLTVRPGGVSKSIGSIQTVLVPTDFSANSGAALPYAVELARSGKGKIVLAHVVDDSVYYAGEPGAYGVEGVERWLETTIEEADRRLDDLAERVATENSLTVEPVRVIGNPAAKLIDVAEAFSVDLIALATHGYTGLSRAVFGSVAEKVVQTSLVPVLSVKPDGCAN